MNYDNSTVERLKKEYARIKDEIVSRMEVFHLLWQEADDERLFAEMTFCLLTPQSKARVCWRSVENMLNDGVLLTAPPDVLEKYLVGVRFKHNKARYIVEARAKFCPSGSCSLRKHLEGFTSAFDRREWLVKTVKGYGYKEASHFLRNIGLGDELAILDRHILKNLKRAGVIETIPSSLSRKKYLEIEKLMGEFSKEIGIPMPHLDLLLWYLEAGEVFK